MGLQLALTPALWRFDSKAAQLQNVQLLGAVMVAEMLTEPCSVIVVPSNFTVPLIVALEGLMIAVEHTERTV